MSSYSYLTVVTIFVAFVVCGASSSYSTYLILFRRFSIMEAYVCSVDSMSSGLSLVVSLICVVGCVYYNSYP